MFSHVAGSVSRTCVFRECSHSLRVYQAGSSPAQTSLKHPTSAAPSSAISLSDSQPLPNLNNFPIPEQNHYALSCSFLLCPAGQMPLTLPWKLWHHPLQEFSAGHISAPGGVRCLHHSVLAPSFITPLTWVVILGSCWCCH